MDNNKFRENIERVKRHAKKFYQTKESAVKRLDEFEREYMLSRDYTWASIYRIACVEISENGL